MDDDETDHKTSHDFTLLRSINGHTHTHTHATPSTVPCCASWEIFLGTGGASGHKGIVLYHLLLLLLLPGEEEGGGQGPRAKKEGGGGK